MLAAAVFGGGFILSLSKSKGYLICLIFLLIFVSAVGRIFDVRQAIMGGLPRTFYSLPIYIILSIDLGYLMIHFHQRKTIDFKCIFVLIYLFYNTIVTYSTRQVRITELLFDGYVWPLTFITVYLYFSTENPTDTIKNIKQLNTIGTSVCMMCMLRNIEIHLDTYGFSGRTIGPIYYLVAFIPFFLMLSTGKAQLLFSIPIAGLILVSTKRTAFLIMFLGFCGYYLIKAHMEDRLTKRIKRYFLFALAGIVAVIVVLWVTNRYDIQTLNRLMRSVDDQGSGRFALWEKVIHYIGNSPTTNKIFGHGFHSVPYEVMPMSQNIYAHNGYLEALYDLGFIGLSFLLIFVFYLLHMLMSMTKSHCWGAPAMTFSIIHMILLSAFGYLFEQSVIILPMVFFWGMSIGIKDNRWFSNRFDYSSNPFKSKGKIRILIRRR